MNYRYYICDVFTGTRFGGNQLAVLPEASGLSDAQMQQITREFNFSETAFVFPARAGHTRHVRIFTPAREIPFAGHPNVGTAFVLATTGAFGEIADSLTVTFEEKAGLVPLDIRAADGKIVSCELCAPEPFSLGETLALDLVAAALSLDPADISTSCHPPQLASVGLPFIMVELANRRALERATTNLAAFEAINAKGILPDLYFYVRSRDEFDIRARMFAPLSGVAEDPATGSANCALAGLLAQHDEKPAGDFCWRIAQGVEMGRPSTLVARAEKKDGTVLKTWVGGSSVLVAEGDLFVDPVSSTTGESGNLSVR
jgi:trans-2,3-dihydro-3-hydroxyanthranilate isomerase